MKIAILNGPNLNLVGLRETHIYGSTHFSDYLEKLQKLFPSVFIDYFQSNIEGSIIDQLHKVGFHYDGIILNAGGYTHTSVAIADAVSAIQTPVVEVHISNIYARASYRSVSLLSPYCIGVLAGLGLDVYHLAVYFFMQKFDKGMSK